MAGSVIFRLRRSVFLCFLMSSVTPLWAMNGEDENLGKSSSNALSSSSASSSSRLSSSLTHSQSFAASGRSVILSHSFATGDSFDEPQGYPQREMSSLDDPLGNTQAALGDNIRDALQASFQTSFNTVHLTGDHSGVSFIPESVAQDLCGWDRYGFAKVKENHAGNHRVVKRGAVHFKLSPGGGYDDEGAINDIRPGMEWAISSFFRLLSLNESGKALTLLAPSSTLIVLNDIQVRNLEANLKQANSPYLWVLDRVMTGQAACFEEVLDRNRDVKEALELKAVMTGKRAIFQASQTIEGEGLDKFLSTSEGYQALSQSLDPTNFSALFLGTLLTNPSDGGPSNYIIYRRKKVEGMTSAPLTTASATTAPSPEAAQEIYGVACIDNDESLASPILARPKAGHHIPNIKAIPFFFPQMKNTVDASFKRAFLKQKPEILLYGWLQGLADQNRRYASLIKEGTLSQKTLHNMFLPIRLRPGLIREMYHKLEIVHHSLTEDITHDALFEKVDPLLHAYYTALQNFISNPAELLAFIDKHKPQNRPYVEAVLKKNISLPLLGMMLLQDRDIGGPFPFESLFGDTTQKRTQDLKALLAKTKSLDTPFAYEEYEQQTIPLSESLRELTEVNDSVRETIFHAVIQRNDQHAMASLLSWGTPQQIIANLTTSRVPLQHLHIHEKAFKDEEAKKLGKCLQQKTELLTLSLVTNHRNPISFSDEGMEAILEGIKDLPFLTSLAIEGHKIGRLGGLSLLKLTQLQELSLPYTGLKDNDAQTLAVRLPQLQRLNLAGNAIETSGASILLHRLSQLQAFNLHRNKCVLPPNKDKTWFLEQIKKHPTLAVLDLSYGGIKTSLNELASALKDNTTLTSLNLNFNEINDLEDDTKGCQKGLTNLVSLPFLKDVNLGKNPIKGKGIQVITDILRQNKGALTDLDLSYNEIGDQGATALRYLLQENTTLQNMNLNHVSFGPNGITKITEGLRYNTTLRCLRLGWTALSAASIQSLLEVLSLHPSLETVELSGHRDFISKEELTSQIKNVNMKRRGRGAPPLNVLHALEDKRS